MNLKFIFRNFITNTKSIYKPPANLSSDKNKILEIVEFGNPLTSHRIEIIYNLIDLKQKSNTGVIHYSNNIVKEFISCLKSTAVFYKYLY